MKPEIMNLVSKNANHLKSLGLVGAGFIAALILIPHKGVEVSVNSKEEVGLYKSLSQKMDDIQAQINKVTLEVKKPKAKVDLSSINNQIKSISGELRNIKDESLKAIDKTSEENHRLSQQIANVESSVKGINLEQTGIKYVDAKKIPFEIFSIDYVQESPVISIRYHFQNYDLEVGETIGGWKVVELNYETQVAEFENTNKEHARLSLNERGWA